LISKAAQSFVRVDGTSKLDKEKATSAAFLKARSRWGLISDAVRLARAWR
ncbi:MAG: FAD-dependent oxidoreductase, partial [Rhizobium ruizarguesonis]